MDAIVSVTGDWGIGYEGRLLVSNRQDMLRFKELTTGGIVICGKRTFESFPGGALPERLNVVITRDEGFCPASGDVIVARGIDEAVRVSQSVGFGNGKVWVIGGESIYRQMLPLCDDAYVTKNDTVVKADTFFPNLDEHPDWRLVDEQEGGMTQGGIRFKFLRYRRRSA